MILLKEEILSPRSESDEIGLSKSKVEIKIEPSSGKQSDFRGPYVVRSTVRGALISIAANDLTRIPETPSIMQPSVDGSVRESDQPASPIVLVGCLAPPPTPSNHG